MEDINPTGEKPDDSPDARARTTPEKQPLAPVTDAPRPVECARVLAQHPSVRDATTLEDCRSAYIEVTLAVGTEDVPAGVVRVLYRRRLAIVDVTTVAQRHLQVTARPRRWAA